MERYHNISAALGLTSLVLSGAVAWILAYTTAYTVALFLACLVIAADIGTVAVEEYIDWRESRDGQ